MALTAQDKQEIKLAILEAMSEREIRMFEDHIQKCPYGKLQSKSKAFLAGAIFVIVLMTSGLTAVMVRLVRF